jgi:hypothetical protein
MKQVPFEFQTAGQIVALRLVVSALIMAHPEPERLRTALRTVLSQPGALYGTQIAPIQEVVDAVIADLTALMKP